MTTFPDQTRPWLQLRLRRLQCRLRRWLWRRRLLRRLQFGTRHCSISLVGFAYLYWGLVIPNFRTLFPFYCWLDNPFPLMGMKRENCIILHPPFCLLCHLCPRGSTRHFFVQISESNLSNKRIKAHIRDKSTNSRQVRSCSIKAWRRRNSARTSPSKCNLAIKQCI